MVAVAVGAARPHALQDVEPRIEHADDRRRAERGDASGHQLDRQREPVEPAADQPGVVVVDHVGSNAGRSARWWNSSTAVVWGSSGCTGITRSPSTPSASRLVAITDRSGHAVSNESIVVAAGPTRCSQLSTTSNIGFVARTARAAASGSGAVPASRTRAIAPGTSSACDTSVRSTNQTRAKRMGASEAIWMARRVLPTPPTPVSVTRRWSPSSSTPRATSTGPSDQ